MYNSDAFACLCVNIKFHGMLCSFTLSSYATRTLSFFIAKASQPSAIWFGHN